jgi:molecular chaperone DnaK (HSP70)
VNHVYHVNCKHSCVSIMSGARAAAPADKEGERGRVVSAKVERYWAGKRLDGDAAISGAGDAPTQLFAKSKEPKDSGTNRTPVAPAVIVKKADDRLSRLARTDVTEARAARRNRHRCATL